MDIDKTNKIKPVDVDETNDPSVGQTFSLPKKSNMKSQHERFNDGDVSENLKVLGERTDSSQDNYDDYTDDNRYEQDRRRSPETGKRLKD